MLTGARFRNDALFAHFLCKEALAQSIIDLVGPRMVQVFPFEIDLGAAKVLGHPFRIVKETRPIGVVMIELLQFLDELGIFLIGFVRFLEFQDSIHQGFRYILPAVGSISSITHLLHPFF